MLTVFHARARASGGTRRGFTEEANAQPVESAPSLRQGRVLNAADLQAARQAIRSVMGPVVWGALEHLRSMWWSSWQHASAASTQRGMQLAMAAIEADVRALNEGVASHEGRWSVPNLELGLWREKLEGFSAPRQSVFAEQCLALACGMHRELGEASTVAVRQLCELASAAMWAAVSEVRN